MPKFIKSEKVDLLSPKGARQRAIVTQGTTGARGMGALVSVKVTGKGHYERGPIMAHAKYITARSRTVK